MRVCAYRVTSDRTLSIGRTSGCNILRQILTVALLIVAASAKHGYAESGQSVLDHARQVAASRQPKDMVQRATVSVVEASGVTQTREMMIYSKRYEPDTRKSIIFFLDPPNLRNVGVLTSSFPGAEDDQWIYFPQVRHVRRLDSKLGRNSLADSDFSFEYAKLYSNILGDWSTIGNATVAGMDEVIDGNQCAVIDVIPKREDTGYSHLRIWLSRSDFTVRKADLYDRVDGKLVNVLIVREYITIDGLPTPRSLELYNIKRSRRTSIHFSAIGFNHELSDQLFTLHSLETGPSSESH